MYKYTIDNGSRLRSKATGYVEKERLQFRADGDTPETPATDTGSGWGSILSGLGGMFSGLGNMFSGILNRNVNVHKYDETAYTTNNNTNTNTSFSKIIHDKPMAVTMAILGCVVLLVVILLVFAKKRNG